MRIIVPGPPGGPGDTYARLLADHFARVFGGTFIVDNRTGASGSVAAVALARAEPDGHTLMIGSNAAFVLTPLVLKNAGYDPPRDFRSVGLLASYPVLLIGRRDLPFRDVPGLIAYARANPGRLNYASFGVGSIGHLMHEIFRRRAGIQVEHVNYPGLAPIMQALLRSEVDYAFDSIGNVQEQLRANQLLPLAVSSAQRSTHLPQVPTLAEAGLPEFNDLRIWLGIVTPARTPQAIVQKLNAELERFVALPQTRKRLQDNAEDPATESPEAMDRRLATERTFWANVVRDARIEIN